MISKEEFNNIRELEKQKKLEQLEKYVQQLVNSVDSILGLGRTEIYFTEISGGHFYAENKEFFLSRLRQLYGPMGWDVNLIIAKVAVYTTPFNSYYFDKFGIGGQQYEDTYKGFKFT